MQVDKQEIEKIIESKIASGVKAYGKEFKIQVLEILGLYKLTIPDKEKKDNLIPLARWNEYHADPTVSALRNLWNRRDENGFGAVVEHRGTRLLINERKYFEWKETKEKIK